MVYQTKEKKHGFCIIKLNKFKYDYEVTKASCDLGLESTSEWTMYYWPPKSIFGNADLQDKLCFN